MGTNYKPDYYRGEGREPVGYADMADPLHAVGQSDAHRDGVIAELVTAIKAWIENPSRIDLDARVESVRKQWIAQGGSRENFATAFNVAQAQSGYFKAFSALANPKREPEVTRYQGPPPGITARAGKPQRGAFNGLNLAGVKL